ncbi:MAG: DUF1016 N-terminal domain-containing protein [Leptolyngbyaceae cyanobacterium]
MQVNRELVLLYWQIGREILHRQQEEGWGAKVIDQLAQDLKMEFSGDLAHPYPSQETWPTPTPPRRLGPPLPLPGDLAHPYPSQETWPTPTPPRRLGPPLPLPGDLAHPYPSQEGMFLGR